MLELWDQVPVGHERRAAVVGVLASQAMEFKEHNVEYGFRAVSSALLSDGTPEPDNEDDVRVYQPDTRPGSPLPHAWVECTGERRALREVAPPTHWMLIAGKDGAEWCAAATKAAAERGIDLGAFRVGHVDGDWFDPRLAFVRVRRFRRSRPDSGAGRIAVYTGPPRTNPTAATRSCPASTPGTAESGATCTRRTPST